mmetsp:Transcript_1687/g.3845  ORF Transcript_1687/g.3845 Transcript_1687/m.3845 type:complete len:785 (+) Transcript_1687:25-2379(+)
MARPRVFLSIPRVVSIDPLVTSSNVSRRVVSARGHSSACCCTQILSSRHHLLLIDHLTSLPLESPIQGRYCHRHHYRQLWNIQRCTFTTFSTLRARRKISTSYIVKDTDELSNIVPMDTNTDATEEVESTTKTTPETESTSVGTSLEDNPCWGSPSSCSLRDLLKVIPHREPRIRPNSNNDSQQTSDEDSNGNDNNKNVASKTDSSILYDSKDYLVLNKPPDLRMDGPYQATVHKLLTYWYPTPSLIRECSRKESNENDDDVDDQDLLGAISQLHQHNHLQDNFLRPCHQLDYATSGILLVAKTQSAAGYIGRLFQNRESTVKKKYVAIVVGHIDDSALARIAKPWGDTGTSENDIRQRLQKLEDSYRRSRFKQGKQKRQQATQATNRKPNGGSSSSVSASAAKSNGTPKVTFQGYQPPHSIYGKWKAEYINTVASKSSTSSTTDCGPPQAVNVSSNSKKRRKRKRQQSILSEDDWIVIWEPLWDLINIKSEAGRSFCDDGEEWWKLDWKDLSRHEKFIPLKEAVVVSANRHNNLLREAQIKQRLEESSTTEAEDSQSMKFPRVFTLKNDSSCHKTTTASGSNDNNDNDAFYVYCPLAEDPGSFQMKAPDVDEDIGFSSSASPEGMLDYKHALTKCTILERGTYRLVNSNDNNNNGGDEQESSFVDIHVTKVHLTLFTGRRHQLRVHMSTAGFPILGDVTYGGMKKRTSTSRYKQCENQAIEKKKDDTPSSDSAISSSFGRSTRMCLHALSLRLPLPDDEDWEVVAPDPFHFDDATGVLEIPSK